MQGAARMAGSDATVVAHGNAGVHHTCLWRRLAWRAKPDSNAGGVGGVLCYWHVGWKGEMA